MGEHDWIRWRLIGRAEFVAVAGVAECVRMCMWLLTVDAVSRHGHDVPLFIELRLRYASRSQNLALPCPKHKHRHNQLPAPHLLPQQLHQPQLMQRLHPRKDGQGRGGLVLARLRQRVKLSACVFWGGVGR